VTPTLGSACPSGTALAGDVRRVRSNFVNGIKELPVTVTLA